MTFQYPTQEHERRHLAEFLLDYDDDRDDQQFYKYVADKLMKHHWCKTLCAICLFILHSSIRAVIIIKKH